MSFLFTIYLLYGLFYVGKHLDITEGDKTSRPEILLLTIILCVLIWPVHAGAKSRITKQ